MMEGEMEEIKENSVRERERKPYPSTASGLKVVADVYDSPPCPCSLGCQPAPMVIADGCLWAQTFLPEGCELGGPAN